MLGDISALARIKIDNVGLGTAGVECINRVFVALRSVSRGDNFTAFLNAANVQNPAGVTLTYGANTANFVSSLSMTGNFARYQSGAAGTALADEVVFTLDSDLM